MGPRKKPKIRFGRRFARKRSANSPDLVCSLIIVRRAITRVFKKPTLPFRPAPHVVLVRRVPYRFSRHFSNSFAPTVGDKSVPRPDDVYTDTRCDRDRERPRCPRARRRQQAHDRDKHVSCPIVVYRPRPRTTFEKFSVHIRRKFPRVKHGG